MKKLMSSFIIMFWMACVGAATAAPRAELWERWIPDGSAAEEMVDHAPWDRFLKRHVHAAHDGINRVNYGAITETDRADLAGYIAGLAVRKPTSLSRSEAKAYWINLYNGLTVQTVLQHYPVKTIRDIDISPGLFSNGPWGAELVTVEGVALSLDDIEHRILRPIWKDPLIHYAVNCAAVGCPQLRAEAFVAALLDSQLRDAARAFVNHRRATRLEDGMLSVSSIYEWFMSDFGENDSDVIAHLRQFAEPELNRILGQHKRIDDDFYDWALNDLVAIR